MSKLLLNELDHLPDQCSTFKLESQKSLQPTYSGWLSFYKLSRNNVLIANPKPEHVYGECKRIGYLLTLSVKLYVETVPYCVSFGGNGRLYKEPKIKAAITVVSIGHDIEVVYSDFVAFTESIKHNVFHSVHGRIMALEEFVEQYKEKLPWEFELEHNKGEA